MLATALEVDVIVEVSASVCFEEVDCLTVEVVAIVVSNALVESNVDVVEVAGIVRVDVRLVTGELVVAETEVEVTVRLGFVSECDLIKSAICAANTRVPLPLGCFLSPA